MKMLLEARERVTRTRSGAHQCFVHVPRPRGGLGTRVVGRAFHDLARESRAQHEATIPFTNVPVTSFPSK